MRICGIVAGGVVASLVSGCGDSTTSPGSSDAQLNLMIGIESAAPGGAVDAGLAAAETIEAGGHTLVIDRAQLVLRKLVLKRVEDSIECPDDDSGGSDDDDCELLRLGPLLVDLPLDGNIERVFGVPVEPGSYRRMGFQLHKPSDDVGDAAFLAANPTFEGISIRIEGTFDGTPFVWEDDVTATQHSFFSPPLEVVASETELTELTLRVDVAKWFRDQSGTGLIDPATATGGALESRVRQNIRASFRFASRRGPRNP